MSGRMQESHTVLAYVFGGLRIVEVLVRAGMSAFAVSVQPIEGGHIVNQQQPQASTGLHSIQDYMHSHVSEIEKNTSCWAP